MTISYHWLNDYLPVKLDPEKLSKILTSIGLEVETLHLYEEIPGSLKGLVVGEVLDAIPHPNADKLRLTKVDIGHAEPLKIVCGAPNVAAGQKVIVATVGTTIHPSQGEPLTMKVAKIRGEESHGMICAEDEIGIGTSHAGILILPAGTKTGTPVADLFQPYMDWIYEIGLTPNRMDAMSHLGVARDVCAWLTHHEGQPFSVKSPFTQTFKVDDQSQPIAVSIENIQACQRYSGISLSGVNISASPKWMQSRLKAIGVRPINNIVDITNYILHETGQPLHAFDADKIAGKQVIVKNLPEGTPFITLDGKERKLNSEDLMICDKDKGMCIAGVFGGQDSGISDQTRNLFVESAWFEPIGIRKTSFRHGLRTDAAVRFEKGVDISGTAQVLQRAALLIKEVAGGTISSTLVDLYPHPAPKKEVSLTYAYLAKLSGKQYQPSTVRHILEALGFVTLKESTEDICVAVPYSKPDITLPADLVEEVMRIDGLDNVEIPTNISITPSVEANKSAYALKEKLASYLVGLGFHEIMTNSISNSVYFEAYDEAQKVRLLNNLSAELDMLRPSMLETGLEAIAYNLNRQQSNLRLFEYGKTYRHATGEKGLTPYDETEHLCLYLTGKAGQDSWHQKSAEMDFYYGKGVTEALLALCGLRDLSQESKETPGLAVAETYLHHKQAVARIGLVDKKTTGRFDIKQNVYFVDIDWQAVLTLYAKQAILYKEVSRFPAVQRDLAMVVDESIPYAKMEEVAFGSRLKKLKTVSLFDLFRSDKIGAGKKSVALSFTFQDEEKTMTDKEIDQMMQQLIKAFESQAGAEIRK
jgi:phenylalanyl-tRNA synthetase beta chain